MQTCPEHARPRRSLLPFLFIRLQIVLSRPRMLLLVLSLAILTAMGLTTVDVVFTLTGFSRSHEG